ncbi:unnamed protein product, partial [Sphacelaria rigidula]
RALASWRAWSLGRSASADVSAAAGDLYATRLLAAGLRGLARVARERPARRRDMHRAKLHLLRSAGLERWLVAVAAARHNRAMNSAATVHWARSLMAKMLLSWEAATVQRWARSRQEDIAADHDRRTCQKRGLKVWTAAAA